MIRWPTPCSLAGRTALRVSTSTTASWNEAATSATGPARRRAARASTQRATAVFRPENEKSNVPSWPLGPRGKAIASGSPSRAARSIGGPPGNGRPSTRATLSKASPAASSTVAPKRDDLARPRRGTSSSDEWPPETSSATAGVGSGPCSSRSTATCAARWFTPYSGLPRASAYALAAATPTSSAPASPGPAVTATASISSARDAGRAKRPAKVGTIASRCARLATSGTTPPNRACSSTLEAIASASNSLPADQPDAGLVAGGLEAEHQRGLVRAPSA